MQIDNKLQKKIPRIKTFSIKINNNNPFASKYSLKRTNSQIISAQNKLNEDIPSKRTNSYRRMSSDNALYDEQIIYNIESSRNIKDKETSSMKKNSTSSYNKQSELTSDKNIVPKKIEELLKYKNVCENAIKQFYNNKNNPSKTKFNFNLNKLIYDKNSMKKNKNVFSYTNRTKESNSNFSENICNYEGINNIRNSNKIKNKSVIYDSNNNNISKKINNKDKKYSKYFKLNKIGEKINYSKSLSTNDFNKIKNKYLNLKNEYYLALSELKKEKKKNKKQKEEIESLRNNIKNNSFNNNQNDINEKNEIIKKLKNENETFRKELVLSQALINSLKSELQCYNLSNNKFFKKIKLFNENEKNNNYKNNFNNSADNIDEINYNIIDNKNLVKKIKELNNGLNKKNEILDSILVENNKLRKELKRNKNNISRNINEKKSNTNNYEYYNKECIENINYIFDLFYKESFLLINKYEQFKNNNQNNYNNIILTETFFKELQNIKNKLCKYKSKDKLEFNLIKKITKIYMDIAKIISNEFIKLFLSYNKEEKYFNKYENNIIDDINNNNYKLNFDKQKYNLIDLCELSTSYIKGKPKDLMIQALNLIKSLDNLYIEKCKMNNYQNNCNINDLIIMQEELLDNIKKKLRNKDNIFFFDYNNIYQNKNILNRTYSTNYNYNEYINNENDINLNHNLNI